MADIELVVKLPEKVYEQLVKYGEPLPRGNTLDNIIMKAVANGTPLPKGHGELKDVNEIWCLYDYSNIDYTMSDALDDAPTIIEADKKESEEKRCF